MINYVLGFLFSEDRTKICLILKNKPDFLAGKYNGIGGKIEEGEDASDAIVREFAEETGVLIPSTKWNYLGVATQENSWRMFVYRTFSDIAIANVKTMEEEVIGVYEVEKIREMNVVSNLHWLIPLSLDKNVDYLDVYYL
jgi:8-oxo-dGTP diphosphatase